MTSIPDLPNHVINAWLTPLEKEIYFMLKTENGVIENGNESNKA